MEIGTKKALALLLAIATIGTATATYVVLSPEESGWIVVVAIDAHDVAGSGYVLSNQSFVVPEEVRITWLANHSLTVRLKWVDNGENAWIGNGEALQDVIKINDADEGRRAYVQIDFGLQQGETLSISVVVEVPASP